MKALKKLVVLMVGVALTGSALAQPAPPPPDGGAKGTGPRGQRGGEPGERRGRMENMMGEMLKSRLGATDEEWKVIAPLLKDVTEKRREASSANGGMRKLMFETMREKMGRGKREGRGGPEARGKREGRGGPEARGRRERHGNREGRGGPEAREGHEGHGGPEGRMGRNFRGGMEPSPEAETLASALENKEAAPADIAAKVAALRASRAKKQAELTAASAKLRSVLTPKQEAHLLLLGVLD